MGNGPVVDPQAVRHRGIEDRTLEHRITTPTPSSARTPQDFLQFDLSMLGLHGQASIPDALAYGLGWQAELDRSESAPLEEQQALAKKLLFLYDYLTVMETEVERDPRDGALLYHDPIKLLAATRFKKTRLLETVDGRGIPVGDAMLPTLPVWAPSVFPRGLSAEERARYPARPRALAEIPPFGSPARMQHWVRLRAARPAPPHPDSPATLPARTAGKTAGSIIAAEPPPPKPVDAGALDAALDRASHRYDAATAKSVPYTATPLVTNAIRQLSRYTLFDLRTATNVQQRSAYEDDKLIAHTEILLYHSVFTVVLDRAGKPFDLRIDEAHAGLLDYALLVPPPGSQMRRALPAPGGVNVSVQTRGDSQFRIEEGKIVKVLQGGVGSFVEAGYGATEKHELHLKIQQFLNDRQANIASVSAEAAFNPIAITLDRIYLRLSDLAEAATPHVVNELLARAEKVFLNWQEYAKIVPQEVIKQVIIGQVRSRTEDYLIKRIGKRIVPVLNAASVVYDLVTGDQERTRSRYAIACAILAIKGRTDEDTELAARVASKVVADAVGDKVIQKLVEHSAKAMKKGKLVVRKGRSTPDHPRPNPQPGAPSEPKQGQATRESAPAASKMPSAQSHPAPTGQGGGEQTSKTPTGTPDQSVLGDLHEGMTAQERATALVRQQEYLKRQAIDAVAKSRALPGPAKTAKPAAADYPVAARHTGDPKTDDPATDRNARAVKRDTPDTATNDTGNTRPDRPGDRREPDESGPKDVKGGSTALVKRRRNPLETPEQVVGALRDSELFSTYNKSQKKGRGQAEAAAEIASLGTAIGQHVVVGKNGAVHLDAKVSQAIWLLPGHLRGVLIERALGGSAYQEWFNVGALDHGFFPQVDFADRPTGSGQANLVSVKTIDVSMGYPEISVENLSSHVYDIVHAQYNLTNAGHGHRTVTVDVRVPQGAKVPAAQIAADLKALVPRDLRQYVKIQVGEF
jgi:hypothetical protein